MKTENIKSSHRTTPGNNNSADNIGVRNYFFIKPIKNRPEMDHTEIRIKNSMVEYVAIQAFATFIPYILIFCMILWLTQGHFTYSLDDPYIHLALAKNIFHGNYGLNQGEFSSPSSSILWPFLLAPFAASEHFFEYTPLAINLFCVAGLTHITNDTFSDIKPIPRLIFIVILFITTNIYGLAFTGMEHSLQTLLTAIGVYPFLGNKLDKFKTMPLINLFALILLPLIRYEGLAITLPILGYIYFKNEKTKAIAATFIVAASIISFSLFLKLNGQPLLPTSVLAHSAFGSINPIIENVYKNLEVFGFFIFLSGLVVIGFWQKNRSWATVIATATTLQFLLGKCGWYGRYEVYIMIFVALTGIRLAIDLKSKILPALLLIPFSAHNTIWPTVTTPIASSNIYNQQAQMANIARRLGEPVAVNDIGLVALRSGQYTLDLWGLGSVVALNHRFHHDSPAWISGLMKQKNVKYAFVYEGWFDEKPDNWIKTGEIKLTQMKITPSRNFVTFYAVDKQSAAILRSTLLEFSTHNQANHCQVTVL